ncbi:unnamed protein product [Fraxinus pennsylvanica]|uniref:CCR4-NOT transcription complex subunit 4 n=1 Tax=Fraxinus pennsylvanica TaxID=56036 RepID=A0AAD1YXP9_9LAMI|nr:unnamed protein product [Fraxinus pennsylvanica]
MSKEEKRCPLCADEMDWTDQQLKPCKCGYQVCVWCWHHIIDMAEKEETEGRCPACRTIYEKEKIVGMQANCERVGNKNASRKTKPPKAKPKINEVKKDLTNVRVIQRKMAYVIGLPLSLADEDLLLQKEYFGQYGTITKVSLSRNASGAIQQFINDTCSVYITYSKEEEALMCIQSVHGFVLEGRDLRASFGTAKYCHAWLKNMPCNNPSCLYLHSIGDEKDSFGKDEIAAVHTRSRVQQIVGAANSQLRRSGSVLLSPVDCNSSSAFTDAPICRSAMIDEAHGSVNRNGDMTCTVPYKYNDGVPAPNKMTTYVDIVGQSNFSCPVKDETIPEDGNLCSKLSLVTINGDVHSGIPYSVAKTSKVSSSNHLGIELCWEEQYKDIPDEPFTEGSQSYDYQGSKDSCASSQRDCFLQQPCPASISEELGIPTSLHKKSQILSELSADHTVVNNYEDDASLPFRCVNSVLNDGCHEMKFQNFAKSDRIYRNSSSFSNEEIVEHLRRIDDNSLTNNEKSSALDAVESSIILNIMEMGFDSFDDSMTLPNGSSELLDETDDLLGSSWDSINGNQSGFSFLEQGNQVAGYVLTDFRDRREQYLCKPQYRATRPRSLALPGFSVPYRDPPPGFSSCERMGSLPCASPGSCFVNASHTLLQMPSAGSSSGAGDVNSIDSALLSSSKGKPANGLKNSGLEMRLARTLQLSKDDAFWFLMQQPASANQSSNISHRFTPQTPYAQQEMSYSSCMEIGLSTLDDIHGLPSRIVDQHQSHNPSSFSQLSRQKYSNGHSLNTNGYLQSLDEVRRRNAVDMIELQRNKRLGVSKYFLGYEDLSFSPDDLYSRVFGM